MRRFNHIIVVTALALMIALIIPWTAVKASEKESQFSLEQTFQQAKQNYLDKNMNSASQYIQQSASYMKAQGEKASDKGKKMINASAKELKKLAVDVKKGTVTSVGKIEAAFARAYAALALDYHIKSTESWAKQEKVKAGDALDAANKYFEQGTAWAGQKIEKDTKEVMNKSEELSSQLKKKSSVVAEDVGKSLKDAGDEIEKFGKKISPQ